MKIFLVVSILVSLAVAGLAVGGCSDSPPPLEDVIESVRLGVVQVEADGGIASGFVFAEDGLVATNAHVVGKRRKVRVWFSKERGYDAEVIGLDTDADLAVVKIDSNEKFEPLPLGKLEDIRLGAEVIALGFPLVEVGDSLTVTRGVLSSTRTHGGVDYLQTDAALNPGNSGGPIIDRLGNVIGISTFRVSGLDVENVGFAVSITEFLDRKDRMEEPPVFASISSGLFHACQLDGDGIASCWGDNKYGQSLPPVGERFVLISSGGLTTCGLREDGSAVCWGRNNGGQSSPPQSERFVSMSSGGNHSCGLREDGGVICWGTDARGQATPPSDEHLGSISSGGWHTCGLREDGSAICWGDDEYGQSSPPEGEHFRLISSGGFHSCGLRTDDSTVCWGRNDDGQIIPPGGQKFDLVSNGAGFTCGLRVDGRAICWGDDKYGQVTRLPREERFLSISSGGTHSCGLPEDGSSAVCWGSYEPSP